MASCDHLAWVQLVGQQEVSVQDDGRLHRILEDLVDVEMQRPTLLFFVGRKAKNIALRELFPYNNIRKGRHDGLANLRLDTTSIRSDFPILFADSEPTFKIPLTPHDSSCHEIATYQIQWKAPLRLTYSDIVHARLFFLFTDVICIFADDFPCLDDVIKRLKSWAAAGKDASVPRPVLPKVVIVVRGDEASATFNVLQAQDLRFNLHQQDLIDTFSSIAVLYLADEQISPLARHRRLKEVVLRYADEVRQARHSSNCLYSAHHLNRFIHETIKHICETIDSPSHLVHVSRRYNKVEQDYCTHLLRFLQISSHYGVPESDVASYVASAMLMDSYPPGMHYFEPRLVYDSVYRAFVIQAFSSVSDSATAVHQSQCVQARFERLALVSTDRSLSTAQAHKDNIQRKRSQWARLRSNRTCLSCLRREPEHTLTCGHAFCDVCVRVFGEVQPSTEYQYLVPECSVCGSGSLTVTLKPPTAGIRILTIDGGGIRGVVPLEFMRKLQDKVGPECPIQDLFDLAFGTSSGGLIVLGLFIRRWNVDSCAQVFDTLSRQFFRRGSRAGNGVFQYMRRVLKCWLLDGYYDVQSLEASLKEHFGLQERLFDHSGNDSNTKVAVTATTISDASPYLFSNYNGSRIRSKDCGYKHFRPENVEDEPHVWEAGRATSAAPGLFRPAYISAVGTFQDGGLKHNNPINLALWESLQIWPSITHPDVVLSLGTGQEKEAVSPGAPNFRHVIQDGFIPRLYRSFMSSLDGQVAWRDLQNRLDQKARENYFRLNVSLSDELSTIDDVGQMDEIRRQVESEPDRDQHYLNIAFALVVASFFFELVRVPIFRSGKYFCQGVIRSRLSGSSMAHILKSIQRSTWAFTNDMEILGYYEPEHDFCPGCHRYHKAVNFWIRHPMDPFIIYMQGIAASRRRKISGFPNNLDWFITQQHLTADFGTPHHSSPAQRPCEADEWLGQNDLKRKSRSQSSRDGNTRKRRREALHEP